MTKLLIDDKRKKRCYKCNEVKSVYDFHKDKNAPTGLAYPCKPCVSSYQKSHHKKCMENPEWLRKRREEARDYGRVSKLKAIKHFGDKCFDCGGVYPPYVYDIHHLDGSTKKDNPSRILRGDWEKAKQELEKCVLLCANCHRGRHFGG